jgi:TPR repeat protein
MSAESANIEAPMELATLYEDPSCGAPNQVAALRWYEEAYRKGWAEAATRIGEILLVDIDSRSFASQAREWFVRGAKRLDGMAAFHLGDLYRVGFGVRKDLAIAFSWYEISERHLPIGSAERNRALLLRDRVREQLTPVEVAGLLEYAKTVEGQLWSRTKDGG